MPLIKSGSKKAISTNIREMMHAGHPQRVAVAAAMSTARKYGRKRAEGGKALKKVPELPPISDGIGQLLKDQETAKLYDQIRNYIFPPEALLAQRGIFPGTSADTMETDASDLAIQRRKLQEGANPWWTAKSFATGGEAMSYTDTARRYAVPQGYQMGGGTPWFARQEARNVAHGGLSGSTMGRADKLPVNVRSGAYVIPADVVSGFGQGNTNAGMLALGRMFGTGPLGMPTMKGGSRRGVGPNIGHAARIGTTKMPKASSAFAEGGADEIAENDGQTTPIAASDGEFIIHPQKVLELGGGNLERGHEILDAFVKHSRKQHIKQQQKLPGPAKS